MRHLLVLCTVPLFIVTALSACSKPKEDEEVAGFRPPTNQSRADYLDTLDRRFSRIDRDSSGVIVADELVGRRADRFTPLDTDRNGQITRGEFVAANLVRFDQADANRDKMLTGDERVAARWGQVEAMANAE